MFITPTATVYEMTYPDPLLRFCESIHLLRH